MAIHFIIALLLMAAPASADDPLLDIPYLVIRTYPVSGDTPEAIRAALDATRPTDPNDGERVDALSRWRMEWRWPVRGGRCDLGATTIAFSAGVTIPRLADEARVAPEVRARWQVYQAALRAHEALHLRDAYRGIGAVRRAIGRATCRTANAAGERAIAAITARAVALDKVTRHGRTTGAVFP